MLAARECEHRHRLCRMHATCIAVRVERATGGMAFIKTMQPTTYTAQRYPEYPDRIGFAGIENVVEGAIMLYMYSSPVCEVF